MYLGWRVFYIRKKKRIRFGFLVQELTQWKSESLYRAMLAHPRFDPVICISPSLGYPGAEDKLIEYCRSKGYNYVLLDENKTIVNQMILDFGAPNKPYMKETYRFHWIENNKTILFYSLLFDCHNRILSC